MYGKSGDISERCLNRSEAVLRIEQRVDRVVDGADQAPTRTRRVGQGVDGGAAGIQTSQDLVRALLVESIAHLLSRLGNLRGALELAGTAVR